MPLFNPLKRERDIERELIATLYNSINSRSIRRLKKTNCKSTVLRFKDESMERKVVVIVSSLSLLFNPCRCMNYDSCVCFNLFFSRVTNTNQDQLFELIVISSNPNVNVHKEYRVTLVSSGSEQRLDFVIPFLSKFLGSQRNLFVKFQLSSPYSSGHFVISQWYLDLIY